MITYPRLVAFSHPPYIFITSPIVHSNRMGLIAMLRASECEIHGISPFSPAADAVSKYLKSIDYLDYPLA